VESIENQPKPHINLAMAPSLLKNKAMNEMIEKLTEIGVDEIHPVIFSRTGITSEKSRSAKWNKIAVQSLKVNNRLWKTSVSEAVHIEEILALSRKVRTRILLDIQAKGTSDFSWSPPGLVVVGPPGDITEAERELFLHNDFSPVNINDCILRTETAALSIAAIIKNLSRKRPA
jgi:16S rRNA (uracil1498-N3)-methyltransferase